MPQTLLAQLKQASLDLLSVVVYISPDALDRYSAILGEYPDVVVHQTPNDTPELWNEADVTIVVGNNNPDSLALYEKCRALKDARRIVVFGNDERGLTFSPPNWRSVHMEGMFYDASVYLRTLSSKGSYVEFGVFDGRSFTMACHSLRTVCTNFVAADSFSGIVGTLENEKKTFADGRYYANETSFRHNLRVANVGDLDTSTIVGSFADTLQYSQPQAYGIDRATIAHFDSDVYLPTKYALDFIEPVLADGSVLMFDEYNAFGASPKKGERRALAEWIEANPHLTVEKYKHYTPLACSFILHRE